jgi:hypothetical protein
MARSGTTIVPSIAPESSDPSLDRLLNPARFFSHPEDVLRDSTLDIGEKRAILSSWASDSCAVKSIPALRKPPGATDPVTFDAIMDALQRLDHISRGRDRRTGVHGEP